MKFIRKILLVCTGNSCRSIMAEGYLKKRLKENGLEHIEVQSAGTGTVSGFTPTASAIEVMKEIGIDVSEYESTTLAEGLIREADLILVMEPIHKQIISGMVPGEMDKVYFLRQFSRSSVGEKTVPDPIGKSVDFYRTVLDMIKVSTEGFIKWLKE